MQESSFQHISTLFFVTLIILISVSTLLNPHGSAAQTETSPQQIQSLPIYDIFNKVENSVVQITTSVPPITAPNPDREQENQTALGSGFVYDENGHIVTNNHVVANAR